ncbi:MAG: MarR family winged helix-turn-helix transcriptional regulator [Gemmatimonadaceae bacterium]
MNKPSLRRRISKPSEDARQPMLFTLLHAARALEQRLDAALAAVELSTPKYGVLTQLVQAGTPLAPSELAARLSCVRSNMTQLVDRLEADGLVRRASDQDDRRIVRVELTTLGRSRQAAGAVAVEKLEKNFARSLPPGGRFLVERALAAME